jgi:hypothetical protein
MIFKMFDSMREKLYSAVPDTDIEDSNSSSDGLLETDQSRRRPESTRRKAVIQAALIVIAIPAALGIGFWLGQNHPRNLDNVCIRHTSKHCEPKHLEFFDILS